MKETVIEWRSESEMQFFETHIKPPFTWRAWLGGPRPGELWQVLRCGDDHRDIALLDLRTDANMPEEERDRIKQSLVDLCNIRWGGAS